MAAPRALLAESRGQDIADEEDGADADANPHPRAGTHLSASRVGRGHAGTLQSSPLALERRGALATGPCLHAMAAATDDEQVAATRRAPSTWRNACAALSPEGQNTCSSFT